MVLGVLDLINRLRVGCVAWILTGLLLPLQVLVAIAWPRGYSLTKNAISDLGVTSCGPYVDGSALVREICSPWHTAFNMGLVVTGILMIVGALLLHGRWDGVAGRVGTVLMSVAGACVVVVGLTPWNLNPDLHDVAAITQALAQWLAMLLLARAAGSGLFRQLTVATVTVSVLGFFVFLSALEGVNIPFVGIGVAERLAFDTLTLWVAITGSAVLVSNGKAQQRMESC